MFIRILSKSFRFRTSRIAVALLAIMVASAIMAAMVSVSWDINRKFSRELRSYGANFLIVSKGSSASPVGIGGVELAMATNPNNSYIDINVLRQLDRLRGSGKISEYVPYLQGVVKIHNQPVVLVGTRFDQLRRINPWWKVSGGWGVDITENRNNIRGGLVGMTVAKTFGWRPGTKATIQYNDRAYEFQVSGIARTGASEDHQIFVDLSVAEEILGLSEKVNLILARANGNRDQVEATSKFIQAQIPSVEARLLRRITESDKKILDRIQKMIFLTSAIILISAAICLMTTMMDLVMERQREVGIMKAIGAEDQKIASLFLSEAIVLGFGGGTLGYLAGLLLAQWIGRSVFDTAIAMRLAVIPIILAISVTITVVSSLLPVKRAMEIEPVMALKGE